MPAWVETPGLPYASLVNFATESRLQFGLSVSRRLTEYAPVFALALMVAWPLIRLGPPSVTDGPNHFYRFVELNHHIEHGDLYPRWFADLHYGFGAPVLNYYGPLSYYLLVALAALGLSLPTAFQIGFILAVVVATCGMYVWVRDQFDSRAAGLTAAAAYSLAPYFFHNLLERAAYPELWALAAAPWLFWLVLRVIRRPSRGARVALTLLVAGFLLTHNFSILLFAPLLVVYALAVLWGARGAGETSPGGALLGLSLSAAHGTAIAAFFLVPLLLESQFVQLQRAADYDFRDFFLSVDVLFSRPVTFNPYRVFDFGDRSRSLAWPQLALALLALAGTLYPAGRGAGAQRRLIVLHSALLAALALLTLDISVPVWEAIPAAALVQFPWRLLGPATLLLAWLAGAGVAWLPAKSLRHPLALSFSASFFFFSLTWSFHDPYQTLPDSATPADVVRFEVAQPGRVGTTGTREFLPRWVDALPAPESLLARYEAAPLPSRLAALPANGTAREEQTSPTVTRLRYDAPAPFTAMFNRFYFPGWTATVDGAWHPIRVTSPHGLIALALPPGRHQVELALRPTIPQQVGSLISLLAVAALLVRALSRRTTVRGLAAAAEPALAYAYVLMFVGLFALRLAVFDRFDTLFSRNELAAVPNPLMLSFDDQLALIGYEFPKGTQASPTSALEVKLFWQAQKPLKKSYQTTIQLVDRFGNRYGQSDHQPAALPTTRWQLNQYARDEHRVWPLVGTPPGEYQVVVGVYSLLNEFSPVPLSIRGDAGGPIGVKYVLGSVFVGPSLAESAGPLRLVDASLASETVGVGDQLAFSVLWHSGDAALPRLSARVVLSDDGSQAMFDTIIPPTGANYPSELWLRNQLILYHHSITLPADLPAGTATVSVTLLAPDGTPASDTYELGRITITVPERSYAVPPLTCPLNHDFGGAIRLLGYDRTPEGISLYWQALRPVDSRLTVFVHRFDEDGEFVAGHDREPPRPTTSWLPREVIVDFYPLDVGAHFQVGLYEPITGERFDEPVVIRLGSRCRQQRR